MILSETEFFKGIESEVMNKITAISKEEEHPKDTVLFKKDEEAKSLFILKEGTVNLVIQNGGTLATPLTESGEVFGWSCMVEGGIYTASGICATDSKIVKIDRDNLEEIFDQHPAVGLKILKRMAAVFSKRLSGAYRDLLSCSWSEPL
ncbi:MAG: cyclic nucleotide-binding domain-containing protein [Deltaproteobacteria bacterium]|jgi:CRP-like cAMP-binding protein|nr:cyclic nucleotide-binding domain-containing protein [Deltaproteobacteria bacterium]